MKAKDILAMALLPILGVLTACSNDETQAVDNRVPITLSATTLTIEETRAAADTALNKEYLEVGQTVKVRVSNTGANTWSDYSFDAGANGVMTTTDIPPFYPMDNTHVDIAAFSPSSAGATFSVQSDQTSRESYLASDLLFASKSNQEKTTAAVPLQFEHKMAKVIVNVIAGAGVSTIEEVTLLNVLPQVTFNSTNGAVGSAQGTATSIKVVKGNTTGAATGAAVFPAQVIDNNLLTIKTNLGTATYSVSSKVFTAGKVYKLTISVSKTSVNTTTAITNWTDTEGVVIKTGDDNVKVFFIEHPTTPGFFGTITMIKVEGGTYNTFGGTTVNGTISDYYISQTEITNLQWKCVMGVNQTGTDKWMGSLPVVYVSYNDITTASTGFLAKLNAQLSSKTDGMTFKLPTEAQWEYAARGGKARETYTYAGTNEIGYAGWTAGNSNGTVQPVATRIANSLGIYDMTGNVWEMCRDLYQASIPPTQNNYVSTSGSGRVRRGAGYSTESEAKLQLTYRNYTNSDSEQQDYTGFRIVLE